MARTKGGSNIFKTIIIMITLCVGLFVPTEPKAKNNVFGLLLGKTLICILFKWIRCDDYDYLMGHFFSLLLVVILLGPLVLVRDPRVIMMSVFANFVILFGIFAFNLIRIKSNICCWWNCRQWNHTHCMNQMNQADWASERSSNQNEIGQ